MLKFIKGIASLSILLTSLSAQAEIKKELVEYKDGQSTYEGYLVYNAAVTTPRSAVLIIHQWMGPTDHEKGVAEKLAEKGYVAFVADIYGKGIRPKNTDEASKLATDLKSDTKVFRQRQKVALEFLAKNKFVNKKQIVIAGYCLGGTGALEAARGGLPVAGAVSFHGGLATTSPKDMKKSKAKVLVFHGAIDPYVKPEEVNAFLTEANDAKIDYQFVAYSGAVHAFTQKAAGNDIKKGAAYNKAADERSWAAFMTFLNEVAPLPRSL
jgi:dienelactone hydrolase